ncbi:MAG: glycerol-3-phosphate dehydrogenase/oxidase [Calditrichaeota bacterium]|nr:MAG: glycerol-3-phosphate dehydrogenase/oxidase [Calditrichota bacterium]
MTCIAKHSKELIIMKRDCSALSNQSFDLLIVGAGIYGVTLAADAVHRGYKVALIDKGDFCNATSANSLKIIHGGLRYLQHADFARMRESIIERRNLLYSAPHLIRPLPCVMPTYGHGIKGPEVMRIALLMNDLFSLDRNRRLPEPQRLPNGSIISRREFLDIMPFIHQENLNGGAVWYDAHMLNSERLLFSFLHSAVEGGAVAANYIKAESLLQQNGRVLGVQARDMMNDQRFDIRANWTISTMGAWINEVLGQVQTPRIAFSTAMNLIINRPFSPDYAFAAPTQKRFKDADALINKGSRLLFFVPWRGKTLAGTAHRPYDGNPDEYRVTEAEVAEFLNDVNSALPGADIRRDEVCHVLAGLLPMSAMNHDTGDVQLTKHYKLIDHQKTNQLKGLISLLSVKYTTARGVAEAVLNYLKPGSPRSAVRKIWGGEMESLEIFSQLREQESDHELSAETRQHLFCTYGTRYRQVLESVPQKDRFVKIASDSYILKAEIVFAVREEMAQKLTDVLMRRTELGSACLASAEQIESVAELMASELKWSEDRKYREIDDYKQLYNVKP